VIHRDVTDADDMREYFATVEWHEGNRFTLNEYRSFLSADDTPVNLFGAYGRVTEKLADGKLFIAFCVSAECEIVAGDRYKIISVSPGSPKDNDSDTW
jgi:hypothetical protein